MSSNKIQNEKLKTDLIGEIAVELYTRYAMAENSEDIFHAMPFVLRELAEAFEEAANE